MRSTAIILMLITLLASQAPAAGPTREELAIHYSGPVTISPWRASDDAQRETSSAQRQWNHYCFNLPAPVYCGWNWCGWYSGYGSFGYSYPLVNGRLGYYYGRFGRRW